eukprot:gene23081-30273_t
MQSCQKRQVMYYSPDCGWQVVAEVAKEKIKLFAVLLRQSPMLKVHLDDVTGHPFLCVYAYMIEELFFPDTRPVSAKRASRSYPICQNGWKRIPLYIALPLNRDAEARFSSLMDTLLGISKMDISQIAGKMDLTDLKDHDMVLHETLFNHFHSMYQNQVTETNDRLLKAVSFDLATLEITSRNRFKKEDEEAVQLNPYMKYRSAFVGSC